MLSVKGENRARLRQLGMQECGMGVVGSKEMIRFLDSMGEGEGGIVGLPNCLMYFD